MLTRISLPLACMALGAAQVATAAENEEGRWSATLRIGTELVPHGKFQAGASGTIADLGTFNPALAGLSGTAQLDSLTFDDIFRVGPSIDLELGYRVLSNLEPFVRLNYSQLRGENARIGDVNIVGRSAPEVVRGDFDDNESWSLGLGTRYFFVDSGPFSSYVAGYVGVNRAEELNAHIRVSGSLAPAQRQILLPRETRFTTGVELGVSYEIAKQAQLRFSVGADYRTQRHEETEAYQALGIDRVRVTDQQWLLPINLGLTYQF